MGLVDRLDGALRRGIVGAKRLDRVANELCPDRLRRARGAEVDHAPTAGEFSRFVGRILAVVATHWQGAAEVDKAEVMVLEPRPSDRGEAGTGGYAREAPGGRGNHD